jgi:hypothetical protein
MLESDVSSLVANTSSPQFFHFRSLLKNFHTYSDLISFGGFEEVGLSTKEHR